MAGECLLQGLYSSCAASSVRTRSSECSWNDYYLTCCHGKLVEDKAMSSGLLAMQCVALLYRQSDKACIANQECSTTRIVSSNQEMQDTA